MLRNTRTQVRVTHFDGFSKNDAAHATVRDGSVAVSIVLKADDDERSSSVSLNVTLIRTATTDVSGRSCVPDTIHVTKLTVPGAVTSSDRLTASEGVYYGNQTFDTDGRVHGARYDQILQGHRMGETGVTVSVEAEQASALLIVFTCD